jgi:predicted CXXCH cytochrome family protein
VKKSLWICAALLVACGTARAQLGNGDVLGSHDLTPGGTSPIKGGLSASCLYCHAPHSGVGGNTPLWNQQLSTAVYTTYTSTTETDKTTQPLLGADSSLCLSCHDGTVAPGQTVAYKAIIMTGQMNAVDKFSTNLEGSHPFSLVLPLVDAPDLAASLVAQGKTLDPTGTIKLINGNVECTSCHNPHLQSTDVLSPNFLLINSANGQLCLDCHDPTRVMTGKQNPLTGWAVSIHATATNKVSSQANVGSYPSVAQNACISCHAPHNAQGGSRLLRQTNETDCVACHSGGTNMAPATMNVFVEFTTPKVGHPFSTGTSIHDAAESNILNNNRHSTCADCHNGHAAGQVTSFPVPPITRASQNGVNGVSATDGITEVSPTVNQYENCLRCHGTSLGKVVNPIFGYLPLRMVSSGDPLNVIPQFAISSTSSHPVTHVSTSPLSQPSLLAYMLNLDGVTQGRSMGVQILCTDCHNSDDNREFGGSGPNGPHGSKWTHILERRYEFSQTTAPGQLITNLFPTPDLSINGPYALCGKCHNLSVILSNSSFSEHARHINDGFSCSACHTAHGMGAVNASISGERLVNFDINVVAPNGAIPITYSRSTNSCNLTCHQQAHTAVGVTPTAVKRHS